MYLRLLVCMQIERPCYFEVLLFNTNVLFFPTGVGEELLLWCVLPVIGYITLSMCVCVWSLVFIWAVQLSAVDYVEAFSVNVIVKEYIN